MNSLLDLIHSIFKDLLHSHYIVKKFSELFLIRIPTIASFAHKVLVLVLEVSELRTLVCDSMGMNSVMLEWLSIIDIRFSHCSSLVQHL
jgi:hypothetical protein